MEMKNAALIGLGAMGVFFAPRMEEHLGRENFCVIAGGERKKRLEEQGVTVNGKNYRFPVCEPENGEPKDLIIMAVKDMGLSQALQDIRRFVGERTQILCVMNGVESEEKVAAVYGWEHTLYSYMRVSIVMKDGKADFDPYWGKVHFVSLMRWIRTWSGACGSNTCAMWERTLPARCWGSPLAPMA